MNPLIGIGLRPPHYDEIRQTLPGVGWLEVHSENYFERHSKGFEVLAELAGHYPVSLHGVGMSLGSADSLDPAHLRQLAALVATIAPVRVSEHLSWGSIGGRYFNDLLPLPYTEEALGVVERNVHRLQERLGRQVLVENPSCYLAFAHSTLSEPAFLAELARRTGCGLLLDANNIVVTAHNLRLDPGAWLDGLPVTAVGQYHLAGHAVNDADGEPLLIDDHGSRVGEGVWALFDEIVRRYGPRPTLVEWDTDLPALDVLLGEARRAEQALGIEANARAA